MVDKNRGGGEAKRQKISTSLPEVSKGQNGQFMTPATVAKEMAGMFSMSGFDQLRLLDPGAGSGSLSAAFLDAYLQSPFRGTKLSIVAYELDPYLANELSKFLDEARGMARELNRDVDIEINNNDFILDMANLLLLEKTGLKELQRFTHVIMNPPYRKLSSNSKHRKSLSAVGIEANNYYSAFVALAVEFLQDGGELVAITPRSFCNGPYFRSFRDFILRNCSFERIHLFESRQSAFKEDDVLQENIIFKLIKKIKRNFVQISISYGRDFKDVNYRTLPHNRIVFPGDKDNIIHIPANKFDDHVLERMRLFPLYLEDLNLDVSTGPVVDFRVREHIKNEWEETDAPLIYPSHFSNNSIVWPRNGKKPNAIRVNKATRKWLMPNGNYVLIRRFSSKEEPRRIIPTLFNALENKYPLIGFENHINVIHSGGNGLNLQLAKGVVCYFASALVDIYFRQFSGHTQVNAADLRTLPIPDHSFLLELAQYYTNPIRTKLIDDFIEKSLTGISALTSPNPVEL